MSDTTMAEATSQNFPELPTSEKNQDVLSDRQQLAIELLIQGKTNSAIADDVGVTRRTIYAWRHDEIFRVELERRRREVWDDATDRLRALVHPAIDVLEAEVHDEYDRSRVRAAGMILRFSDLRKHVAPKRDEG